ncbi:MAG TPA: ATP-binding protein, partial [Chloroflexia bacterium]|nr:ATP-binding protein [Chloroflexia bacterium]
IQVDPSRIRQALENLLANAVKYSPKLLPVHIVVRAETREHAEGEVQEWAVISVHDEGPGIPASLLPTLFTRFSAGPGSTGLGLGLYLAHSIATAHSGTLTVQSEPGQGTRFVMSLPGL